MDIDTRIKKYLSEDKKCFFCKKKIQLKDCIGQWQCKFHPEPYDTRISKYLCCGRELNGPECRKCDHNDTYYKSIKETITINSNLMYSEGNDTPFVREIPHNENIKRFKVIKSNNGEYYIVVSRVNTYDYIGEVDKNVYNEIHRF